MLCLVPALRSLRRSYPQAEITLVGLPESRFMLERFPQYLDELLVFPGFPGMPERQPQPGELPAFFKAAGANTFDLALQMHGNGAIMNVVTALLGARHVAGFYLPGSYCPDEKRFLPFIERESEVRRYLRLLSRLGLPLYGEELEFPVNEEDRAALAVLPESDYLSPGSYACLHPGASVASRRWTPERFAEVGDYLAEQGLQVVLTGSASEQPLIEAVCQAMQAPYLNLAGKTGLGTLAALFQQARLLVCNDTGVSHLAAAVRLPSVVIFSGSDPARWAPLNRQRHRIVSLVGQDEQQKDGQNSENGLAEVLAQVEALLGEGKSYAA